MPEAPTVSLPSGGQRTSLQGSIAIMAASTSEFLLLVQNEESERVEFLADASEPRIFHSISAHASGEGGTIVVGVRRDPLGGISLVGADRDRIELVPRVLQERFQSPAPEVELDLVEHDSRTFGILRVKRSPQPPRLLGGETYRRNGTRTVRVGDDPRPLFAGAGVGLNITGGPSASAGDQLGLRDNVQVEVVRGEPSPPPGEETPPQPTEAGPLPVGAAMIRASREAGRGEKSLRVDEQAEVLASLFNRADERDAFSFGLFGPWGRGKSYLMREVSKRLSDPTVPSKDVTHLTLTRYGVVHFSAWRYRRTPEVWAFLYETVLEAAKRASPLVTVRAALVRYGPWPAIWAVFGLGSTLFSVMDRLEVVEALARTLGVVGIIYFAYLLFRFKTLARRLQERYAAVARYDDKLGLQAAIGEDLKALLIAWTPRDHFDVWGRKRPSVPEEELPSKAVSRWAAVLYVLAALFVARQLWPSFRDNTFAIPIPFQEPIPLAIAPWAAWLPFILWLTLSALGPLAVMYLNGPLVPTHRWRGVPYWFWHKRDERILLVVDDLDRCDPVQMLEVIESTALILDDPEIRRRVQICMLIDEASFTRAVLQKYRYLKDEAGTDQTRTYSPERIVRENLEKYFLVHFRLLPLDPTELVEVMDTYVRAIEPVPASSRSGTAAETPARPPTVAAAPQPDPAGDSGSSGSRNPRTGGSIDPISPEEAHVLRETARGLAGTAAHEEWGPRAVRSLLFRYVLARELLLAVGERVDPSSLANALVQARPGSAGEDDPTGRLLNRVVAQVR